MRRFILITNLFGMMIIYFILLINTDIVVSSSTPINVTNSGHLVMEQNSGISFNLIGKSGLLALGEFVNRGSGANTIGNYFLLYGDNGGSGINFLNEPMPPIGIHMSNDNNHNYKFRGNFNGRHVMIENARINVPYPNYPFNYGFFGVIEQSRIEALTISGITIENNNVSTTINTAGSIVGIASDSHLSGINVLGSISFIGTRGFRNIGGIVGQFTNGGVNTLNVDIGSGLTITANGSGPLGGLFAQYNGTTSAQNISVQIDGDLKLIGAANTDYVGSIAGLALGDFNNLDITINGNINISGRNYIGALIGSVNGVNTSNIILKSSGNINVSGTNYIGGIAGSVDSSSITHSTITTNQIQLTANGYIGALAGQSYDNSMISNTIITTNNLIYDSSTVDNTFGGLVGYGYSNSIEKVGLFADVITLSGLSSFGLISGNNAAVATGARYHSIVISAGNSSLVGDMFAAGTVTAATEIYFNSGITSDNWYSYNLTSGFSSGIDISTIKASQVLNVINGSGAFRLVDDSNSEYFYPVLKESGLVTLANQPKRNIYWLTIPTPPPPPSPAPQPTPEPQSSTDPVVEFTFSPIRVIPLVETFEIIIESGTNEFKFGDEMVDPIVYLRRTIGYYTEVIDIEIEVSGDQDPTLPGTYTRKFTTTYMGQTFTKEWTYEVIDETPPVIMGPKEVRLLTGQEYRSNMKTDDDSKLATTMIQLTPIDTSVPGEHLITWIATDFYGNSSKFYQRVVVQLPLIEAKVVTLNDQSFVFVISERDFNLEYGKVEVSIDGGSWMEYSNTEQYPSNIQISLRYSDGLRSSEVKHTLVMPKAGVFIPNPPRLVRREEVSVPYGWISIGAMSTFGMSWTVVWKRRDKDE